MSDVALNRKARRSAAKAAAAGAATVTAAALMAGISAPTSVTPRVVGDANIRLAADPITVPIDLITTGGILGLVNTLGYKTFAISLPGGAGTININLHYVKDNPEKIYNAINAITIPSSDGLGVTCGSSENPDNCRLAPLVTIGSGMMGLSSSLNSLWSIAQGINPKSWAPLPPSSENNNVAVVVNDPLRPNGGVRARFGAAFPNVGSTFSAQNPPTDPVANNHVFDFTWEYQPKGDFPATLHPLSVLNSLMAALPPVVDLLTSKTTDILNQIAVTTDIGGDTYAPGTEGFTLGVAGLTEWIGGPNEATYQSLFATLVPGSANMPLFEPLNLGLYAVNNVLNRLHSKFLIGNPINNIFGPVAKILVNIGYTDVVTPTDIKNDPSLTERGYTAYDRTFSQDPTKLGSQRPLTPEERRQVPGDVWNAFTAGLKAQASQKFFGLIVPNPTAPGAATKAPAPAAVSAPKAAAAVATADNSGSGSDSAPAPATRRGSGKSVAHSAASKRA